MARAKGFPYCLACLVGIKLRQIRCCMGLRGQHLCVLVACYLNCMWQGKCFCNWECIHTRQHVLRDMPTKLPTSRKSKGTKHRPSVSLPSEVSALNWSYMCAFTHLNLRMTFVKCLAPERTMHHSYRTDGMADDRWCKQAKVEECAAPWESHHHTSLNSHLRGFASLGVVRGRKAAPATGKAVPHS